MPAQTEDGAYHHQAVQNSHYNSQVSLKEDISSTIFDEPTDANPFAQNSSIHKMPAHKLWGFVIVVLF